MKNSRFDAFPLVTVDGGFNPPPPGGLRPEAGFDILLSEGCPILLLLKLEGILLILFQNINITNLIYRNFVSINLEECAQRLVGKFWTTSELVKCTIRRV